MTLVELHTQRGFEKGVQQGLQQARRKIARNMLREGLDLAFISKMTGIDISSWEEIITSEENE
jgi:predicted transposase YdaD